MKRKKGFLKKNKKNLLILFIVFIAFTLRIWQLNQFPIGIAHDEIDYVINAKSIFLTGKDISQTWSPFSLTAKKVGTPTSELLSLITSPITGPFKLSFLTARLPYLIASLISLIFLYLIVKRLIDEKTALITALLMAINPWSFHFGRIAFDSPVAIMFYLIAFYLVIKNKGWKILTAFPFLFLGFFCYHGTKVLFFPFVLAIIFIRLFLTKINFKKEDKKPYLGLILLSLVLVIYFLSSLKWQTAGKRTNEFLPLETEKTAQAVNTERRLAINNKLNHLISNKPIYILKTFSNQYLGAFSTNFLFLTGEQTGALSNWEHGQFYYIDFIFLIIGLFALSRKNKKTFAAFLFLALIAPLPSALSSKDISYVMRSALLFPILTIFIASGIKFSLDKFKYKKTLGLLIVFLYFLSLINYLYIYFYRYPVYGSEGFFFSERLVSEYIKKSNEGQEILVLTQEPGPAFEQYLFYSNKYNKNNAQLIAEKINNKHYQLNNIQFSLNCSDAEKAFMNGKILIVHRQSECKKDNNEKYEFQKIKEGISHITDPADSGTIFRIFNDQLCQNYQLGSYTTISSQKEFNLEKMSPQKFCEEWISKKN